MCSTPLIMNPSTTRPRAALDASSARPMDCRDLAATASFAVATGQSIDSQWGGMKGAYSLYKPWVSCYLSGNADLAPPMF